MKTLILLLILVLFLGCVSQKQAYSPTMHQKRKCFTEKHGQITNSMYDVKRPTIFR